MSTYDEDPSVSSGHFELEVLIHRPAAQVWRQYVDMGSWVTTHDIENVYGVPGTVGSIMRVSFKNARDLGMPPAHYHYCKIVERILERRYLLRSYSEKGGSYGLQMSAFDDARFVQVGNQTKVAFNFFAEARGNGVAKTQGTINLDVSREGMLENLNNLKRIVEA